MKVDVDDGAELIGRLPGGGMGGTQACVVD